MYPEDFDRQVIKVNGVELNVVTGGSGPPLFLLHGFPQTHLIWHRVAPALARDFRLVIPDLRGYGDSQAPPPDPDHRVYSKREMARDIVALAEHFEFERFALAGHDRGARVGYRLVLDHPGRVTRFCVLDIIPTLDVWEQMDADKAVSQFHWPFLATGAPLPERIIGQDPGLFYRSLLERWAGDLACLDARAVAAYLEQYRDPRRIEAQCEDYRAGATVDRLDDLADREAGRKLDCPVRVLWGRGYLGKKAASPIDSWRRWADEVSETALDCGHFIVEEEPELAQSAMAEFFG
ncbi:MAG TPA: alpha/beta hydrolase [Gammaproteobacteria bacterium]|nr:alpha/beta hydrolase [Gammaproteobacteria bacterium]